MTTENGFEETHPVYGEFVCPDGTISTKVPVKAIKFQDLVALQRRIDGPEAARYARYAEHVRNGEYCNGLPVIYRTAKGNLIASDLRYSDLAIHAERYVDPWPEVPRNRVHPMLSVKVIDVQTVADIPEARSRFLALQDAGTSAPTDEDVAKAKLLLDEWQVPATDKGPMAITLRNIAAGNGASPEYLHVLRRL